MDGANKRLASTATDRRGSIARGFYRESLTDKPRCSILDIESNEDDELNSMKGGSSVRKSGWKGKLASSHRFGPVHKFLPHTIQRKSEEVMEEAFGTLSYDHTHCREAADKVVVDILLLLKEQVFDRYRYIVKVVVGEKKGHTAKIASRTLLNVETDNVVTFTCENRQLFAVCMIFALYFY